MICRELLKLPALKNISVAAGANGLERTVRWVYTSECFEDNREIVDWLYGGELVFITGRDIKNDETLLLDLIQKINDKNVSGLLINLGPYISEIPQSVVELANKLEFPIFTIPWETRLVDVTREICTAIITKEMEEGSIENLLENILVSEASEEESLWNRAAYYGYQLNGLCMMCIIDIYHFAEYLKTHDIIDESSILEMRTGFKRIIQEVLARNNRKALLMLRSDSVLILIRSQQTDSEILNAIFTQIKESISKKLGGLAIKIGIGNAYAKLSEMKKSLKEAEQALKIAKLSYEEKACYHFKDLDIYSLILGVEDVQLLENYYQKMLGQLLEHDRINSSSLVSTLETFINESGNLSASAEKLYIHRNTLIYRINKIEEITSVDLREIKEMMKFEIAFMIGRYLKNCFN
jgi:PucR family transcriptional regulator, proline-responsive transcriptional activator